MNSGDWIQLLIIIIVFAALVLLVYSIMAFVWWVTLIIAISIFAIGYTVNRYIKL